MNRVTLIGNLGRDPESKQAGASVVTQFTVATSEKYTDKSGEKVEKTEWHRVVVWGKLAEICAAHLTKGRKVAVEGKIQSRKYQDKEGQEKQVFEIIASDVEFLSPKSDQAEG